ncbi:HYR domain-containing protein [Streptomyces sp. NPDC088725]|uniref:HYR domain-containing protein n=1 Tax=Streptomyces sp. NPDC088725 TaxID=3365873 RepID=UPI0037F3AD2E
MESNEIAEAIAAGLSNLPTSVAHRLDSCDQGLTVALDPPIQSLDSGGIAHFAETIGVAADAPQGTTLTCTVQFSLGSAAGDDPDFQQRISIDVNDVEAPVVTVDDRIIRATGDAGARVSYTATATDAEDGPLPVSCTPASGSLFRVGLTTVTCSATDSAGNTGTDTAQFEVSAPPVPPSADVAVKVDVTPDRTYTSRPAQARYTIPNAGPDTADGVVISSSWPSTPAAKDRTLPVLSRCAASAPCTIPPGGRIEVTQTATYRAAISGEVRATVTGTLPDSRPAGNRATAQLRLLKPSLTVTPAVTKPGRVVVARGKDYPPGETVRLTWSLGITEDLNGVTVGRDGTFEAQVLVMRKDRLGPRRLRADAQDLLQLKRPVLVVQQPPDFEGRA